MGMLETALYLYFDSSWLPLQPFSSHQSVLWSKFVFLNGSLIRKVVWRDLGPLDTADRDR
jgi:hypothetical protein